MAKAPVETFDYVVVGAGSSGCVVAARLSKGGRHSVAVLEAGSEQWPKITAIPAALIHTIGKSKYDWQYVSEPDPTRDGRTEAWPRGKGPGGSGLINGMIFVRGARGDFDTWQDLGATGWSYDDVLPYFRRMERSNVRTSQARGEFGPQSVQKLRYIHPVTRQFIDAAVNAGIPFTEDYNGTEQDGVGFVQAAQENGRRHSPFDAFLKPALKTDRVKLFSSARVKRVLFDGRKATGVEFVQGDGDVIVQARHKVILSGGAINSPQLLMLSGIGDSQQLASMGIDPIAHSPEVGANLMEHVGVWLRAQVNVPTLNQEATPMGKALALLRWMAGGGPATTATAQAVAFVRTQDGLSEPDVQIHFTAFGFTGPGETDPRQKLIMVTPSVNHPESRGEVRLRSADSADTPLIMPRLLDSETDMATLRRGIRLCSKILASQPLASHVEAILEPPPLDDDDALDSFIRAGGSPLYHPVGTCRMGSDDSAVVKPDLNVRGVAGLAVADVSIMPRHISGNTHACALMIGERAADLLRNT